MDFTQLRIALAKPVCSFHGIAGHAVLVLIKNLCGTALPNRILIVDQHAIKNTGQTHPLF